MNMRSEKSIGGGWGGGGGGCRGGVVGGWGVFEVCGGGCLVVWGVGPSLSRDSSIGQGGERNFGPQWLVSVRKILRKRERQRNYLRRDHQPVRYRE